MYEVYGQNLLRDFQRRFSDSVIMMYITWAQVQIFLWCITFLKLLGDTARLAAVVHHGIHEAAATCLHLRKIIVVPRREGVWAGAVRDLES